ncbi:hypothetical protein D3C73_1037360 [compost metagenome]
MQQVINYQAKLWFGQRITATVRIQALGRTSLTMAFQVTSDAGEVAAHGTVTTVHVPNGSTTARPWPEHFVKAVQGS